MRLVIAGSLFVLLAVGPLLHQVIGIKTGDGFPKWRMFTGTGRDVCQVDYYVMHEHGVTEPIDHERELRVRSSRRNRVSKSRLSGLHRRMCYSLKNKRKLAIDLRVRARCGSRRQWQEHSQEDRSVCNR